jgi:hypothetical protein
MRRFWFFVATLLLVAASGYVGYSWQRLRGPPLAPPPLEERTAPQPTEYGTWLAHAAAGLRA